MPWCLRTLVQIAVNHALCKLYMSFSILDLNFTSVSFHPFVLREHSYPYALYVSLALCSLSWHCVVMLTCGPSSHLALRCVIAITGCCTHFPHSHARIAALHLFFHNILNSNVLFFRNAFLTVDNDNNTTAHQRVCWQGQAGVTQQTFAALFCNSTQRPMNVAIQFGMQEGAGEWSQRSCVFSKDEWSASCNTVPVSGPCDQGGVTRYYFYCYFARVKEG